MAASTLDWALVQAFLAVAEHGSLSAAARALGASQPTLGRQIKAMEEQLAAELFQRHEKGLSLTQQGEALLPAARAMREAAFTIELKAAGSSVQLEGTVRISASVVVAMHHLPPIVARVRELEPHICIELAPSDASSRLHYREADIAIRMYKPTQLELVTQFVGDLELAAFASKSYVARRGMPQAPTELVHHDIVGMDKGTQIIEGFRQAGFEVSREWFAVRCDEQATHWALVRAGCGIGFGQRAVGLKDPQLVEIPLALGLPRLPLWLTAHSAVRHIPRVARVWQLLAEGLKALAEAHTP